MYCLITLSTTQTNVSIRKFDTLPFFVRISKFCIPMEYQAQIRSSRSQMLFEIDLFKNFTTFTGKHLCWSLFLIKLQVLLKKRLQHRCFPVNIPKFLKNSFFYWTFPVTASLRCAFRTLSNISDGAFFDHRCLIGSEIRLCYFWGKSDLYGVEMLLFWQTNINIFPLLLNILVLYLVLCFAFQLHCFNQICFYIFGMDTIFSRFNIVNLALKRFGLINFCE